MIQQTPQAKPALSRTALVVFALALGLAGSFVGQYVEKSRESDPQSKLQVAIQNFQSGYDQAALSTLKPLADQGNAKAQYWLADIYENGLGVKKDVATSTSLLEKSAAQGFAPAEGRLGALYLTGEETLQDFTKAEMWLKKAATAGSHTAERQLGDMFALGLGVPKDLPTAYAWYSIAALHSDGLAKHQRDEIATHMTPAEQADGEKKSKEFQSQHASLPK